MESKWAVLVDGTLVALVNDLAEAINIREEYYKKGYLPWSRVAIDLWFNS